MERVVAADHDVREAGSPVEETHAQEVELHEARERAREGRKRDTDRKPPVQRSPAIKLAPMPTVKQPPAAKSNEPAPQKPDLKLPLDAIRAGRSGATPLSEHIRKHEAKRQADRGKGRRCPGLMRSS